MQKFTLSIYSLCTLIVLGFALSSCKDDDDPFVPAKLSVADETLTISENGGTVEVELILDKAAPAAFTVEYSLGGTATSPADYSVVGREGEIDFPQGATSVVIEIEIENDAIYEGNETIEVTLEEVNTENVTITNDDESVITITEDDAQISVSFETTTLSVSESDGILSLNVVLSQAAVNAVTIEYGLTGTARDSVTARNAEPDLPSDYAIRGGTPGQLQIAAGQTTGVIRLGLYSDFVIEDGDDDTEAWDPETIIITMTEASGLQINPDKDELQIDLHQQDGKVIVLIPEPEDNDTEVDMDLFLWIGDLETELADLELVSLSASSTPGAIEVVFIPETITEVKYGLSYVYWGGDVSPMEFESRFIDFVDGELGSGESFTGTYTLANLNPWENLSDVANVNIAQTFEVNADGEVENISAISVPTEGSRGIMLKLPAGTKKSNGNLNYLRKKF